MGNENPGTLKSDEVRTQQPVANPISVKDNAFELMNRIDDGLGVEIASKLERIYEILTPVLTLVPPIGEEPLNEKTKMRSELIHRLEGTNQKVIGIIKALDYLISRIDV